MKRMKIFIVPMLLLLILCTLCSCGGNVTVNLGVIIYIQKDNSTYFTANELKHLRITANGMVASDHSEIDETKKTSEIKELLETAGFTNEAKLKNELGENHDVSYYSIVL